MRYLNFQYFNRAIHQSQQVEENNNNNNMNVDGQVGGVNNNVNDIGIGNGYGNKGKFSM